MEARRATCGTGTLSGNTALEVVALAVARNSWSNTGVPHEVLLGTVCRESSSVPAYGQLWVVGGPPIDVKYGADLDLLNPSFFVIVMCFGTREEGGYCTLKPTIGKSRASCKFWKRIINAESLKIIG